MSAKRCIERPLSKESVFPGRCCEDPRVEYVGFLGTGFDRVSGCERPAYLYCIRCGVDGYVRCNSSRESRCVGCAARYQRRVRSKAESGLVELGPGRAIFATLTAPGVEQHCSVHQYRRRGCPWAGYGEDCRWCPCTDERGVDGAEFNRTLTARVNRWLEAIKRGEASPLVKGRRARVPLIYFQAREVHRNGVLHVHLILCREDGRPLMLRQRDLKLLAMAHGFGHAMKAKRIDSAERACSYVAKYVSKAVDARSDVAWRDDEGRKVPGRYRAWSSARKYGLSMAEIKRHAFERYQGQESETPKASRIPLDSYWRSYAKNFAEWKSDNAEAAVRSAFWRFDGSPGPPAAPVVAEKVKQGVLLGPEVGLVVARWLG